MAVREEATVNHQAKPVHAKPSGKQRKPTIPLTIRVRIEANMEISCPQFTHFSSNSKELAY
jgi:hypothetical protein